MHRLPLARTLCCCLATLVLILLSPAAQAEEQALSYRLLAQDRAVGNRTVTVKYLPTGTGELRLIEAWTSFVLPVAKGTVKYEQRLGGRCGGDRGFVASMATNGAVREVQGRQEVDGSWSVSVADADGARSWTLEPSAVDLTSAELFDQERALRTLGSTSSLKLLSTETGSILEGPVQALGPTTMAVGPDEIEVQRYRFEPAEGTMTLAYTQDGWLVAYDYQVLGMFVGARLEKLPPQRTFGTVLDAPLTTSTVSEEAL